MNTAPSNFYITGGTLRRDAPSYVKRKADDDLYDSLNAGHLCYVLTSRQMGKSSLMVHTAGRLRQDGVTVAVLDLTAIGQNVTVEQWYEGLIGLIGQQIDLEDELEERWGHGRSMGPLQRWMWILRDVVLANRPGRIIIFVDEIDAVRSLPFSTDEFFAGIRELYNRRTLDSELERLTFCILGAASPVDLIRDTRTTPFNIGRRIELSDFVEVEAAPLALGLGRDEERARLLLRRILYWTGGHPYLTQRLCVKLAADDSIADAHGVDRKCAELFFSLRARETEPNLLFVRERMLRSEDVDRASLLDLYQRVHRNKRVPDDETNIPISILRLSGITRAVDGQLKLRNRIYEKVFDRQWIKKNLPDAEVQRQRMAFRKGVLRTAAIALLFLSTLALLSVVALRQRAEAQRQRVDAEAKARNLQAALDRLRICSAYYNSLDEYKDKLRIYMDDRARGLNVEEPSVPKFPTELEP